MRIIGLDLESTGLEYAEGHKIIELALGLYNDKGQREGGYVARYNPGRPIDPKAQAAHGITFEELADKPTFDADAARISAWLNAADALVAHNGEDFDIPFINHELMLLGVPTVKTPLVDTLLQGRWATPTGKVPLLRELCFATGVEYDPAKAHAAAYDVDVMMQAFFKGWRKGFFTIPTKEERMVA